MQPNGCRPHGPKGASMGGCGVAGVCANMRAFVCGHPSLPNGVPMSSISK